MLELNPRIEHAGPQAGLATQQLRRLQVALVLLLVALAVVLVKDREFWFGSDEAMESDAASSESVSRAYPEAAPASAGQLPSVKAATAKNHLAPKTSTASATEPSHSEAAKPDSVTPGSVNPDSPVVATTRAVLPPMDVEVVAGDTHRIVRPGSNVARVQIPGDSNRISEDTTSLLSLPTNASDRERVSSASITAPQQTVDATYPLLGQHTRVQGSVVLQAVVGADGTIEDLRVISGPSVLTTAAQQAVRQWRFKPYLQNGQPVETKARITVNFSIRISDNPPKTS